MPAAIHAFISTIFGIFCQRIVSETGSVVCLDAFCERQDSLHLPFIRTN